MQGFTFEAVEQPVQLPNVDEPEGVAVIVTTVPTGNWEVHTPAELAQLKPPGLLEMFPAPAPPKVTPRAGPAPVPVPLKQVTLAVM
jgi:hypothetical protein